MNFMKSLHRILSYVLIFSLLWQNSLWAAGGIHVLEEDLVGSRIRTYGARNIGVVDPGTIRDGAVHNMFEDLLLLEEGGIVFKTSPEADVIYNRVHSEESIYLSGILQADRTTSMVFTNPGGMLLDNPDFRQIEDLTVAAGHMALTDRGMAYGVDERFLSLHHTLLLEENDLRSLALAGRGIHLHKSFLSSSESITLRAGHYIQGIDHPEGEWIDENDCFFDHDDIIPSHLKGISFDKATTLRSKGLFLDSLEEGVALYSKGLLHSTLEDITIFARGDVYLDRIIAKRNLRIETTGKVFFGNQTTVGGSIHINAKGGVEIAEDRDILAHGPIHFGNQVSQVINRGKLISQAEIRFDNQDVLNEGELSAYQGVFFTDLKNWTNNGKFSAFGAGLQGRVNTLENNGKIDLSTAQIELEKGTNKKDGVIRTAGHFIHQGDHFYNQGKVFTCGVHQTILSGVYEDRGTFYSPTLLLLQAANIKYVDSHKSLLRDGVIKATSQFAAGGNVSFTLHSDINPCFLQLSSQGDLNYNGQIRQFSSSSKKYPVEDYFTIFGQPSDSSPELANKISSLSLEGSKKIRKDNSRLADVTLSAGRNINCRNANINPESGSVSLVANGQFETTGAKFKSGYFTGNNASIKSTTALLQDTALESLFGISSVTATHRVGLYNSHVLGGQHAALTSQFVDMNQSTAKSSDGTVFVHGYEKTTLTNSSVQARAEAGIGGKFVSSMGSHLGSQDRTVSIVGTHTSVNQSKLTGKQTATHGTESLSLSMSVFESEYNRFTGNHINATSNTTKGHSYLEADTTLNIHDLQANGSVQGMAPTISLSDKIKATNSLNFKGETVNHWGLTHADEHSKIIATQHYVDTENSQNSAGKTHTLIAPHNNGFNGHLTAEEKVVVDLKDMCLRALLNQTDAPTIQATLREGNIILEDDLVIKNTLHLWANRLENKAKLTANKDFLAYMQTSIINDGFMSIRGKGALSSESVANYGTVDADDLYVNGKHILSETQVQRHTIAGGYAEVQKKQALMVARTGDLTVDATDSLQSRGAKFEAKGNVTLKSEGILYLGAQQTVSEVTHSIKNSHYECHTQMNHKTQVNTGEKTDILSDQDMILEGVDVASRGKITVKSKANLAIKAVYDTIQEERHTTSKGGVFGRKKSETRQESTQSVVRDTFKSDGKILLEAKHDNHVQAPDIESNGPTEISSLQSKVYLESAKSSHMVSVQKQSKSLVWQSQQQKGSFDEKVELPHIHTQGSKTILDAQGIVVDYIGDLDILQNDPSTSWIKALRKDPQATWHLIEEEHKKWSQKVQGLTGPAAAVIALAISIATAGTGAALAGLSAGTMQATLTSTAFTSLVTQASVSLINNQGNLSKTFKDLGSSQQIRSFATSVLSAGITQGLSTQLNVPSHATTFTEHLQKNLVNSGTSAGLNILLHKQDVKEALLQAAKGIASGTLGGVMANTIGTAYGEGDLNWVTHKLAHGALGGFTGAILGDDLATGALAGALGGMASEIIADALLPIATAKAMDQALAKARSEGRPLAYEDVRTAFEAEANKVTSMSRLGSAMAAFALDQDVNIATAAATNAVENNFLPLVLVGLSVASALYSSYEVYSAYKKGGAKGALEELAKQGVINLAGGAVGKLGSKAAATTLKTILDKNPMLAMVFGKAKEKIGLSITKKSAVEGKRINNDVLIVPRAGSGLKDDLVKPIINEKGKWVHEFPMTAKSHGFPDVIDNYAGQARQFDLERGAKLYQMEGFYNGQVGRFEWIIQDSKVTHRMFIENGKINGISIQK
ncbi:MAG: DUF637 domain-containing protein [Alphaproteobacteria bacterium]|nr:DUF637 domain-containing protein [Alphaproteobacteria bacterium]